MIPTRPQSTVFSRLALFEHRVSLQYASVYLGANIKLLIRVIDNNDITMSMQRDNLILII